MVNLSGQASLGMKTICIIVVCALSSYVALAQKSVFRLPAGITPEQYEPGVVWVKVKANYKDLFLSTETGGRLPSTVPATYVKPLANIKSRIKAAARIAPRKLHVDISSYFKLGFDKNLSLENYINDLYATGYFELIEPVYTHQSFYIPNDPAIGNQYYLNLINADEAWNVTTGSPSIVIAIVDTGGDLNHPDLQGNIFVDPADPTDGIDNDNDGYIDNNRGWDFSGANASLIGTPGFIGDNNPTVYAGNRFAHGTMVAGCASASTNDGIGISGVGFNTKLMFTKHYADDQPDNSNSYSSNLYEGVYYAATHGAKIINCSWGNPHPSGIAQDIITHVTMDLGCLVVAAAGNSNSESPLYPAAYDHVLSVASSDENDLRAWFSNYGKTVDLIAPGSNIYTTNYDDGYRTDSGTSLSAPIVSGAAALVWAHNPTFTPLQVAEQLRISADETFYINNNAYINKLGNGRLDIARALTFQSPSIRASNQILVNSAGNAPWPGENVELYFDFTNYLKPSSAALTITLTSASPYINVTRNQFTPGAMGTNQTVTNADRPFKLTLAANLPIDEPVEALLTFSDGSYVDTQLISFVMPSFIDINENNITTTITSSGRIGYGNSQSQNNGAGFVYNDEQLLYEMGVVMGTSSTVIFDNVRSTGGGYNQDFTSALKITKETPGERSYSEVTGSFINAPAAGSESLHVSYQSLVWKNEPYQNFVILEYKIKNTTTVPLTNFYMGMFADWDVLADGGSDKAGWDNDTRLGYVYPAQPSGRPRVGIQALNGTPNYYAIDNDQTIPGNAWGLYDGFTDAEKFAAISGGLGKVQAGGAAGSDVSQLVSAGPYTINGGEEVTIAFALHGGNSLAELITSAKYADSLYNFTLKATKPIAESVEVCTGDDAALEATGASKFNWYRERWGGDPVFSGPAFTIPDLKKDTLMYVANANNKYESVRTSVAVTVTPAPVIRLSGPSEFCEGLAVTLSVDDEGYNYIWSDGAQGINNEVSTTGSYTATLQSGDLECISSPVEVTVHPNPVVAFNTATEVIHAGSDVEFVNDSEGATSWLWDFGDGSTSTEENPVHIYAAADNYYVTLTATSDEGCEATASRNIGLITGTETSAENSIELYPNPVLNDINVLIRSTRNAPTQIKVFNVQGELVYQTTLNAGHREALINASGLARGVYQVNVSNDKEIFTKKIIVLPKP